MVRRATEEIHKKEARAKLKPRLKAPYFQTIAIGLTLGYNLPDSGAPSTWIARRLGDDGKYTKVTLGYCDDGKLKATLSTAEVTELAHRVLDKESLIRKVQDSVISFDTAAYLAREWGSKNTKAKASLKNFKVSDAVDHYLEQRKAQGADARNISKEKNVLNKHLTPTLLRKQVADLTANELKAWKTNISGTVGNKNRVMSLLRRALNVALEDDLVKAKTWDALKTEKEATHAEATGIYLTESEISDLIKKAPNTATANLIHAAALSGFRVGELVALSVGDYNTQTGVIHVPKDKTKERNVHISNAFASFIKTLSKGRKKDEPLLVSPSGERWRDGEQYKAVKSAVANTELDSEISIYDIRHSYITHALQKGLDTMTLAKTVGTSVKMIEKYYFHVINPNTQDLLGAASPSIQLGA